MIELAHALTKLAHALRQDRHDPVRLDALEYVLPRRSHRHMIHDPLVPGRVPAMQAGEPRGQRHRDAVRSHECAIVIGETTAVHQRVDLGRIVGLTGLEQDEVRVEIEDRTLVLVFEALEDRERHDERGRGDRNTGDGNHAHHLERRRKRAMAVETRRYVSRQRHITRTSTRTPDPRAWPGARDTATLPSRALRPSRRCRYSIWVRCSPRASPDNTTAAA